MAEPERIRQAMTQTRLAVRDAPFDATLYTGEFVDDPDTGESYFADLKTAAKLFDAAIEAERTKLAEKFPWVDEIKGSRFPYRDYEQTRKGHEEAGALLLVDRESWTLKAERNVLRAATVQARQRAAAAKSRAKDGTGAGPAKEPRYLVAAQIVAVKQAKTRAMRRAVAESPRASLALAIMGLLDCREIRIERDHNRRVDDYPDALPKDAARLRALLAPIRAAIIAAADPEERAILDESEDDEDDPRSLQPEDDGAAAVFALLVTFEEARLVDIQAALVAERIGAWIGYTPALGETPLAAAIAEHLPVAGHLVDTWRPAPDYFAGYGKELLLRLAIANGLADGFAKLKKGEMVKRLADQPEGFWTPDKFDELAFVDDETMKKALDGPAPVIAPAREKAA
jgi:hypothetical protein